MKQQNPPSTRNVWRMQGRIEMIQAQNLAKAENNRLDALNMEPSNDMEFDYSPTGENNSSHLKKMFLEEVIELFNSGKKYDRKIQFNSGKKYDRKIQDAQKNQFVENLYQLYELCKKNNFISEIPEDRNKFEKLFDTLKQNNNPEQHSSIILKTFNLYMQEESIKKINVEKLDEALSHKPREIIKSPQTSEISIKCQIDMAYGDNNNNLEKFGTELFQEKWKNVTDEQKRIVERGFKVLQKAYPNGDINDDFQKVEKSQHFKDFLKVCAIVLTLGLAALSEKTTLQHTKKKNFNSFKELVKHNKKNPQHQK
jgi:hypothetical protein